VFNAAFGIQPITEYLGDWKTQQHKDNGKDIHDLLIEAYKADPKEEVNFYIITDPERWLRDEHVQRRVLNFIHQVHNNVHTIKMLIFVGSQKFIPHNLQRYISVVHDPGPGEKEIEEIIRVAASKMSMPVPPGIGDLFRGLTRFEIHSAIAQSVIRTREDDPQNPRIDPAHILEFRRRQIHKTDLLQYVDTSKFTMNDLGGTHRFKTWAKKTRSCWTPEGKVYGLKPPRGVLCVGVWGCGKSLATKSLGSLWGLPVVQLELGRLQGGRVGESEGNAYRALRIIESLAPCIVWVDEAEKSFAGTHSSSQSDAGTVARVVGILSTWIQETKAQVCLVMTANSLASLPVEFVNRMDERFFFDLPSTQERIDILKIHLRKANQKPEDYNLADLAERANNMVGREIEQALNAALIESFNEEKPSLDEEILGQTLERKPRIVKTMVDEVRAVLEWVGYDESVDDGIRARFASEPNRNEGSFKFVQKV
jgi:AAA+ superfamily predicted ATPase